MKYFVWWIVLFLLKLESLRDKYLVISRSFLMFYIFEPSGLWKENLVNLSVRIRNMQLGFHKGYCLCKPEIFALNWLFFCRNATNQILFQDSMKDSKLIVNKSVANIQYHYLKEFVKIRQSSFLALSLSYHSKTAIRLKY